MRKRILVRGPALSLSGYGEQTRFALRSLKAYEELFDIYLQVIPWGRTGWIWNDNEEREWMDSLLQKTAIYQAQGGQFDMSLQITIPNEWEKLAPVNVGYTAGIETDRIAAQWIEKSALMDRIIVISNHSKHGFDNTTYIAEHPNGQKTPFKCTTPVTVVNYPVREYEAAPMKLKLKHDFNFLAVAQWSPRKNIENLVRWWVEEFIDQEVGLVLKTFRLNTSHGDKMFSKHMIETLLAEYPDRKCSVNLIHGSLTDEEMTALYQHPKIKAFITLAHGEGFGLPIFEAAYNGMPVIAPAWSGQCDFLYAPVKRGKQKKAKVRPLFARVEYTINQVQPEVVWDGVLTKDSMWCYPEQGSYKMKLRDVYKNYSRYKGDAKKLQKYVSERFSAANQYKAFADAVYGEKIDVQTWFEQLSADVVNYD